MYLGYYSKDAASEMLIRQISASEATVLPAERQVQNNNMVY